MSTIVFHPLPELGHIAPTMHVANALEERGHRVLYWVEEQVRHAIESRGFSFVPYLASIRRTAHGAPASSEERKEQIYEGADADILGMVEGIAQEELLAMKADLLVGDLCRPVASLVARRTGLPFVRCSSSLSAREAPGRAPLWSHCLPGECSDFELGAYWTANRSLTMMHFADSDGEFDGGFFDAFEAGEVDYAESSEDCAFTSFYLRSDPELVLSSRALDLPNQRSEVHYAGPCLGPVEEHSWTYPSRREGAPLVYCSFGSQALRYRRLRDFVPLLCEVAARRPHLDLVFAGPEEVLRTISPPSNLHTTQWVPQRSVLEQASAFITHGGLGSIKEAAWAGVPLLVYPQAYDQPGNAARVHHHKIGLRVAPSAPPSAQSVGADLDRLLEEPEFREAAQRMSEVVRADASPDGAVNFIEAAIRDDREARRAPYRDAHRAAQAAAYWNYS